MFVENLEKENIEKFIYSSKVLSFGKNKIKLIAIRKRTHREGFLVKYSIDGQEYKIVLTDFEIFVPNIMEIAYNRNMGDVESLLEYVLNRSVMVTNEWRTFMATKFPYYRKNCDEYLDKKSLIEKESYRDTLNFSI